jgi:hypothetical protein
MLGAIDNMRIPIALSACLVLAVACGEGTAKRNNDAAVHDAADARFHADREFEEASRRLQVDTERFKPEIERKLGLRFPPQVSVVITYRAVPNNFDVAVSTRQATTERIEIEWSPSTALFFGRDPMMVKHELAHALLRANMSVDAYRSVTHWAREGIAVWAATQIDAKRDARLVDGVWDEVDPLVEVPNLDGENPPYYEAAARVAWLEKMTGEQGVRTWIAAIAGGGDTNTEFARIAGLDWQSAKNAAFDDTIAGLRSAMDRADYNAFAGPVHSDDLSVLETLIGEHPRSPLVRIAVLHGTRVACDNGTLDECERWLRRADPFVDHYGYLDHFELAARNARLLDIRGEPEEAKERLWRLVALSGLRLPPTKSADLVTSLARIYRREANPQMCIRVESLFVGMLHQTAYRWPRSTRYWLARMSLLLSSDLSAAGDPVNSRATIMEVIHGYPDLLHTGAGGILDEGEWVEAGGVQIGSFPNAE